LQSVALIRTGAGCCVRPTLVEETQVEDGRVQQVHGAEWKEDRSRRPYAIHRAKLSFERHCDLTCTVRVHIFAIISDGTDKSTDRGLDAGRELQRLGRLSPLALILVRPSSPNFVIRRKSFDLNKRLSWGRWLQSVHTACRSAGYRASNAIDDDGGLLMGRKCIVWSASLADHLSALKYRWALFGGRPVPPSQMRGICHD